MPAIAAVLHCEADQFRPDKPRPAIALFTARRPRALNLALSSSRRLGGKWLALHRGPITQGPRRHAERRLGSHLHALKRLHSALARELSTRDVLTDRHRSSLSAYVELARATSSESSARALQARCR